MSFIPGLNASTSINISNTYSSQAIYIGDEFNQSVVSFKAFIESLSYDLAKESEAAASQEMGSAVFKTKSGLVSIKVGFSVVASNLSEAKNNLAKISHLQNSIRMQLAAGILDDNKNRHIVYFTNLINNGFAPSWKKVDGSTIYTVLRQSSFACAIDEVVYKPDTSAGFLEGSDGLYPKAFSVNLTLNPDMSSHYVFDNARVFMKPFNSNGQYSDEDFAFFPFLIKVGDKAREATAIQKINAGAFDYSIEEINESALNYADSNSKILISLPINFDDLNNLPRDTGILAEDPKANIMRYVVFKSFLDDFSRKFSTITNMYKDPNGFLDQRIQGVATNNPVDYSLSFSVPCANLTEAKHNAAKMQLLMRMFFKRKTVNPPPVTSPPSPKAFAERRLEEGRREEVETYTDDGEVNDTSLNSLVVYVGGILQKGGTDYSHTSDVTQLISRGMYLQTENLTINIDVKSGFFEESGKLYPKAYKVDMTFKDTHSENYYKQDVFGNYEGTFPTGSNPWDNRTDLDVNRQSMLSRTTYWKVGGN